MADRLSDMVRTRQGKTLLDAICASTGESQEEALITALTLYHGVLAGTATVIPDLRIIKAASDAARHEVLSLMGHV